MKRRGDFDGFGRGDFDSFDRLERLARPERCVRELRCGRPAELRGEQGFLSGEDEPMNVHRASPAPGEVCVVRSYPAEAGSALCLRQRESLTAPVPAGASIPLGMDVQCWGGGLGWSAAKHAVEVYRSGLYCIQWQLYIAAGGVWPVVVTLENREGRQLCAAGNIGVTLTGLCVCSLNAGEELCLYNRSAAAVTIAELSSDTTTASATLQAFSLCP